MSHENHVVNQSATRFKSGNLIHNRYRVEQILIGGMSEVYLCNDTKRHRPIAIKSPALRYHGNREMMRLFATEATIWSSLGYHPNIVQCYGVLTRIGAPMLTMARILPSRENPPDLRGHIAYGPFPLQKALSSALEICRGLEYARTIVPDLVHGDLKPENILVDNNGAAKIADFGLAGIRSVLEEWNRPIGTPSYMAPELWVGGKTDIRVDIYALGCLLFELVCGKTPYQGTPEQLAQLHRTETAPTLNGEAAVLNPVLQTCLAKQPEERFQSPADLARALTECYREQFGPPPRAVSIPPRALDAFSKASIHFNLGQYEQALAVCRSIDPEEDANFQVQVLELRGRCHLLTGNFEQGQADFELALKIDPENLDLMTGHASVLFRAGRMEEALEIIDSALAQVPISVSLLLMRADIQSRLGRLDLAEADYHRAVELQPDSIETLSDLSVFYLRLKMPEKAEKLIDRAMELDSAVSQLCLNKALCLVALKRQDEALEFFNRACELDDTHVRAFFNRGIFFQHIGKHEAALADFNAAIQISPVSVAAYSSKATLLFIMNRLDEAMETTDLFFSAFGPRAFIELEMEESPDFLKAAVHHLRGVIFEKREQPEAALEEFRHAVALAPNHQLMQRSLQRAERKLGEGKDPNSGEEVEEEFKQLVHAETVEDMEALASKFENTPETQEFLTSLQHILAGMEDRSALQMSKKVSRLYRCLAKRGFKIPQIYPFGTDIPLTEFNRTPETDFSYFMRGCYHQNTSRPREALADFVKAAKMNPSRADYWLGVGQAHLGLGEPAAAAEAFFTSLELSPGFGYALSGLGRAFSAMNRLSEAETVLDNLVLFQPEVGGSFIERGLLLLKAKKYPQARADFEKAVTLAPDLPDPVFYLAQVHQHEGNTQLAIQTMQDLIARFPDQHRFHDYLGGLWFHQNRLQDALEAYEKALALAPDATESLVNRGMAALALDKNDIAKESFETVIEQYPNHPVSPFLHHNLGKIYWAENNRLDAVTSFQKAEKGGVKESSHFLDILRGMETRQADASALGKTAAGFLKSRTVEEAHRWVLDDPRLISSGKAMREQMVPFMEKEGADRANMLMLLEDLAGLRVTFDSLFTVLLEQPEENWLPFVRENLAEPWITNRGRGVIDTLADEVNPNERPLLQVQISRLFQMLRVTGEETLSLDGATATPLPADVEIRVKTDAPDLAGYARQFRERAQADWSENRYEQAVENLDRAVEISPNDHLAYTMRADYHRQTGNHRAAIEDYSRAITLRPYDFDLLKRRGQIYITIDAFESARADFAAVLDRTPRDTDALICMTRIHLASLDYENADTLLDTIDDIQPDLADSLRLRGDCAKWQGNVEAARRAYGRLIEVDKDSPSGYALTAYLLTDESRFEEALPYLRSAELRGDRECRAQLAHLEAQGTIPFDEVDRLVAKAKDLQELERLRETYPFITGSIYFQRIQHKYRLQYLNRGNHHFERVLEWLLQLQTAELRERRMRRRKMEERIRRAASGPESRDLDLELAYYRELRADFGDLITGKELAEMLDRICLVHHKRGDVENCLAVAEEAEQLWLAWDPDSKPHYPLHQAAEILEEQGRLRESLEYGLRGLAYFSPSDLRWSNTLYHLGNVHEELGDIHNKYACIDRIIREGRIDDVEYMARTYHVRGMLLVDLGRVVDALPDLYKAMEMFGEDKPDWYTVSNNLGKVLVDNRYYADARALFHRTITAAAEAGLEDRFSLAFEGLFHIFQACFDRAAIFHHFRTRAKWYPPQARTGFLYAHAKAFNTAGRTREAIETIRRALTLVPPASREKAVFLHHYGQMLIQENRLYWAAVIYHKALELDRHLNAEIDVGYDLYYLGDIERKRGNLETALPYNEQAASVFSKLNFARGSSNVIFGRAMIMADSGRPEEAQALYPSFLDALGRSDPDTQAAHLNRTFLLRCDPARWQTMVADHMPTILEKLLECKTKDEARAVLTENYLYYFTDEIVKHIETRHQSAKDDAERQERIGHFASFLYRCSMIGIGPALEEEQAAFLFERT